MNTEPKVFLVNIERTVGSSWTRVFSNLGAAEEFCIDQNLKGIYTSLYEKKLLSESDTNGSHDDHKEIEYSIIDGKFVYEHK